MGIPIRIRVVYENTETKPTVALEKLKVLYGQGVKIVVGPMASSEVRQIKTYADENKILVFSPSSTATDLAIPDDYIFRNVPDDTVQGRVIAKLLYELGYKVIVLVWRGDTWGDGLKNEIKKWFLQFTSS